MKSAAMSSVAASSSSSPRCDAAFDRELRGFGIGVGVDFGSLTLAAELASDGAGDERWEVVGDRTNRGERGGDPLLLAAFEASQLLTLSLP